MPAPETALIETLKALRGATGATAQLTTANSETARDALVKEVDFFLGRVSSCIDQLSASAAEVPTLFGRNVGDGLDAERADARQALALLRSVLHEHALRIPTPTTSVQLSFAGSRLVSGDQLDLVNRLLEGQVLDQASTAYLEATGQGAAALGLLRLLVNGSEGQLPLLRVLQGRDCAYIEHAPGMLTLEISSNEEALLDALKAE